MPKFTLPQSISNTEALQLLQGNLRHPSITGISLNEKGICQISSKWTTYTVDVQGNQATVKFGWSKEKLPLILILAVLGVFTLVTFIPLIVIAIPQNKIQKEMTNLIYQAITAPRTVVNTGTQ